MKSISKRLMSIVLAIIVSASALVTGIPGLTAGAAASAVTYNPGDKISFGLYPQTKVTNTSLITALNGSTLASDNTVIYGGDKYQRVYFTQYSPRYLTFAATAENSWQDDNGYYINTAYWFKFEPIQWRVLSNTDDLLFVMAEKILDARIYHQTLTSVTWETSAIRSWLNNEFYNKAFTMNDRTKIKLSDLVNEINPWDGISGGNNTSDRLFLLSYSESINTAYGFNSVYETNDTARRTQGTDYAKSCGLLVSTNVLYPGNSDWWLRSPGGTSVNAGYVSKSGSSKNYTHVITADIGIRPACRIRLSPVTYSAGDILEFGSYPQSAVTDTNLITTLNTCTLTADNTVVYNGKNYKKVLFSQYSSITGGLTDNSGYTYQDNNGYYKNMVYWFQCEPIRWRVLSSKNGNLFVLSDKILDSKAYNPANSAITWEASAARAWLNNEFYNAAFSSEERAMMKTTTVINSNNPVSGVTGGNNTADKLFLISYTEAQNSAYGFPAAIMPDVARTAQGTDFSKCSGLYVNTGTPNTNNSYWWLRSPGNSTAEAGVVIISGGISSEGVNQACLGIRPAMKLNLESAAFTPAENTNCVVDYENKYIYGLTTGLNSLDGYVNTINGYTLSYTGVIGTGTRINLSIGGWVLENYRAIVFGDVNGDGIINSVDADLCVEVQNWKINWGLDPYYHKAGDVNGDGNIDAIDADIMKEVANWRMHIDQATGLAVKN